MDVQALIDRTRSLLMTGKQDRMNVLASDISANADTITLSYDTGPVNAGTVLSIGLENFLVLATAGTAAGSNITVIPAHEGSPTSAHVTGDLVRINPQFSTWTLLESLREAVLDIIGEGCFYVKDISISYNPSIRGYEFTADDFLSVYRVRYAEPGPAKFWAPLRPTDYYVDTHADPTDFPSGKQLVLRRGGHPNQPVRMSYRARFGDISTLALTDDVLDIGIHAEGQPVLPYCAATAAMTGREIKRNFTTAQPEPRRAEEVPPGAVKGSMEAIQRAYYLKLETYLKFLHRLYPPQVGP